MAVEAVLLLGHTFNFTSVPNIERLDYLCAFKLCPDDDNYKSVLVFCQHARCFLSSV